MEKVIQQVLVRDRIDKEGEPRCGYSLPKRIADALRAAGLLAGSSMPLTATALAELDRVQGEVYHNWSRHGDEAEVDELRKVANAARRDLGIPVEERHG